MGTGFGRFEVPFDAGRDLLGGVIVDVVDEVAGIISGYPGMPFRFIYVFRRFRRF